MINNISISQSQISSLHGTPIQAQNQNKDNFLTDRNFPNTNSVVGNQINNVNGISPGMGINSGSNSQLQSESKKPIRSDSKEMLPKSLVIEEDKKDKLPSNSNF